MHPDWKQRLIKAIDDDERSDRAISLAAKLGANFIGQMRGSETSSPKEPSVQAVLALSDQLGIQPVELFAGTATKRLVRDEAEILAFLARIDGLSDTDIGVAFAVIKNALDAKPAAQERSDSRDRPPGASRRRESVPSR